MILMHSLSKRSSSACPGCLARHVSHTQAPVADLVTILAGFLQAAQMFTHSIPAFTEYFLVPR
jgi:hypothetical protein